MYLYSEFADQCRPHRLHSSGAHVARGMCHLSCFLFGPVILRVKLRCRRCDALFCHSNSMDSSAPGLNLSEQLSPFHGPSSACTLSPTRTVVVEEPHVLCTDSGVIHGAMALVDWSGICLGSLDTGIGRQLLPCGHVMHEFCTNGLRKKGASGRCPLCRRTHADRIQCKR